MMMKRDPNAPSEPVNTDLKQVFREIREDVEQATTSKELTELYKRAAYLIMMTHASPVQEDTEGKARSQVAEDEFAGTVRTINKRAQQLDTQADYSERWDELTINGYEAEGDNLLEPESVEK